MRTAQDSSLPPVQTLHKASFFNGRKLAIQNFERDSHVDRSVQEHLPPGWDQRFVRATACPRRSQHADVRLPKASWAIDPEASRISGRRFIFSDYSADPFVGFGWNCETLVGSSTRSTKRSPWRSGTLVDIEVIGRFRRN